MITFEAIIARLGTDNPPTFAELTRARELGAAMLEVSTTAGENFDLAMSRDIAEGIRGIDAALATIQADQDAAMAEAAELRALLGDEADELAGSTEAPAEAPPAAVPAAPTTASGISLIERLRSHGVDIPSAPDAPASVLVRAVGPVAGDELAADADMMELGQLFASGAMRVTAGAQPLVRVTRRYAPERILGRDADVNTRLISDLFGPAGPLTAAGGLCGPGDVDFSHPVFAESGRPIRDALPGYNASRGKVTFGAAISIADTNQYVSTWTVANDVAAVTGSPTKPCPRLECPEDITCEIEAIPACITVGNLQAKFSPEHWAATLVALVASSDRKAEQHLLQKIHASSTLLPTVSDGGNTLTSFLTGVERTVSGDRAIQRNSSGNYRVLADAWLRDAFAAQIAGNLGGNNRIDALDRARTRIDGWLSDMGVTASWTYDGSVKQSDLSHNIPNPTSGAWLTQSTVYIFPEGSHLYLDGGTLDLGTSISDSALNAVNDRQAFSEIFETTCFRGVSSYKMPLTVATKCGC